MHFFKKNNIQIFLSLLILSFLLFIQIRWMNKALQFSEEQFKYKVGLALDAAILEFGNDSSSCEIIDECLYKSSDFMFPSVLTEKVGKLDSIFQRQLDLQNIKSSYTLDVLNKAVNKRKGFCFNYNINGVGFEDKSAVLNVSFKEKQNTIIDSMKMLFICSVILIVLLFLYFIITVLSLLKEKKIQGQTKDLINNITHEFKTPMATIALAGSMLKKERIANSPKQVEYYAGIISSENMRLSQQVEQLLTFESIERNDLPLNKQDVDVVGLIKKVSKLLQPRFDEGGVLDLDFNVDEIIINADSLLLENVIINLIDNAIKYSKGNPIVNIYCTVINNYVCIQIKDEGVGISKENQKYVYNKYFRVSSGDLHDVKGFGIGLSYVNEVLLVHKGSISLESKLGEGSVFTVKLPLS